MRKLREQREQFAASIQASNTGKAYSWCWKQFSCWCLDAGRKCLPASDETVSLFVTWLLSQGRRIATAQLSVSAIAARHKVEGYQSPQGELVRSVLKGARRQRKERPQGKAALAVDQLRLISRKLDDGSLRGARDRACLVFGFASGLRRSEIVALNVDDVRFCEAGSHH